MVAQLTQEVILLKSRIVQEMVLTEEAIGTMKAKDLTVFQLVFLLKWNSLLFQKSAVRIRNCFWRHLK